MGKKVLTVDDSYLVRNIISKILVQFSAETIEAENGEEGIDRAREHLPDLILLDYNMPVMDGYHALIELKTDPKLKKIPVVMVTTETSKETVIKLLKLGLDDYIAKPFTRELLLKKINPILKLYSGDEIPPNPLAAPSAMLTAVPARPAIEQQEPADQEDAGATESTNAILVVDDKSSIRELMKEYLGVQYNLMTVDCGRAALAALAQRSFDHIFLDLGLPDMSGLDVLAAYLKDNNGASEKNVIAMTLRSALQDIHKASEAGIQVVLYKPFTRVDVNKAIEQSVANQKESSSKKFRYLTLNGKIMTLECPAQKSSRFRFFVESLNSTIPHEVEEMADGGVDLLIIKIGDGFLSSQSVIQSFLNLMQLIQQMSLTVRFVASSAQSRDELKKYNETAGIPTDVSMECALSYVAC